MTDSAPDTHGRTDPFDPPVTAAHTPRPWPDCAPPDAEQLATWLSICTNAERAEACHRLLESSEQASRCFMQDHERRVESAEQQLRLAHDDIGDILNALGIGDHARPISTHQVVQQVIVPAITALRAGSPCAPNVRQDEHGK